VSALVDRLFELIERGEERCAVFTVVEGDPLGAKVLALESGEVVGDDPLGLAALADDLIRASRNKVLEHEGRKVFVEIHGPPPRLLVYGAVDSADTLCAAAKVLGWHTIVADARGMFATEARIPHADELIVAWPEETFAQVQPDHATAVVVLTHDDKFDVPALKAAVESDAFYIGALGSRRNQERRRAKLLEAGMSEADFERISGPCGLDVGADTPAETAISILAEALALRAGRDGGRLSRAKGRIHVEVS
jgi:xanthine dehydrogenase accessory factor